MANPSDRAAFYLCLARAFMPPRESAAHDAFKRHLAQDLAELVEALEIPAGEVVRDLGAAIARVPDHDALLRAYSALFLAPPVPVTLNAGLYLDGAITGRATSAIEKCYQRAGLTRAERFHDLPDHIALQLEFAAFLCASEAAGETPAITAGEFLATFARYWIAPFVAALEKACSQDDPSDVYLRLGHLLRAALAHELRDYRAPQEAAGEPVARSGA